MLFRSLAFWGIANDPDGTLDAAEGMHVISAPIELFTGMAMKSSKAVIVTSFLLILLTQANIGDFSFAGNLAVPLVLTAASFLFAALTVFRVETKDLM